MTRSGDDDDDAVSFLDEAAQLRMRLRGVAGKGPSRARAARAPATSIAKVEADRGRKNSRVKGSRAELDVAAAFSRWCGEEVRRTPLSGGWSTARFGVTADLVCANPAFPFHVEIKHREGWTLDDLVTGARAAHDKSVVQWWAQCVRSCPTATGKKGVLVYQKEPLLVFRRNRQPWLAMCAAARRLGGGGAAPVFAARFKFPTDITPFPDVVVARLDAFLREEIVPRGLKNGKKL